MMNSDNDFPLCMSFFSIKERLRHLGEWVSPVNDRCDLYGFEKAFEKAQIRPIDPSNKEPYFLVADQRQKWLQ